MAVITVVYDELEAGSRLRIGSSQEDLWTLPLEISGQMLKGKTLFSLRVDTVFCFFKNFLFIFNFFFLFFREREHLRAQVEGVGQRESPKAAPCPVQSPT